MSITFKIRIKYSDDGTEGFIEQNDFVKLLLKSGKIVEGKVVGVKPNNSRIISIEKAYKENNDTIVANEFVYLNDIKEVLNVYKK